MKEFAEWFYKSRAWRRVRKAYIDLRKSIDGGLCERCRTVLGYIVHHKIPLTPQNIHDPEITYAGIVANAIVTGQIMSQDGSMIIDLNDANINMDLNDGSKVIIGKEGFYNMFGGSKNEYFHLLHAERVSLGWGDFKEGMATHLYTLPEEFAGKDVTIFGVINEFIAGANKAMTHLSTDYVYSEETRRVRAWVNANTVDSSFNTIDPAPPASVIITFIAIA